MCINWEHEINGIHGKIQNNVWEFDFGIIFPQNQIVVEITIAETRFPGILPAMAKKCQDLRHISKRVFRGSRSLREKTCNFNLNDDYFIGGGSVIAPLPTFFVQMQCTICLLRNKRKTANVSR